jgi:nucleoside-diphosphate-sugar epimerase
VRVLLTGAGGFSGRFLARRLAEQGHDVISVLRRPPQRPELGVPYCIADLSGTDPLPRSCEAVIHTAATSPMPGVGDADMQRDNVVATERLIAHALAQGARRFIFFSSLSLYGRIDVAHVDETTPFHDAEFYGRTKQQGEAMLAAAAERMPALALRLPAVVGPGAKRNWPASVVERIRRDQTVSIFNPEAPFNNAVHIADLADLVTGLLARDWSRYDAVTLGAAGTLSIRDVVERLARGSGRAARIEMRAAAGPSFTVSSERAKTRYGYAPMEIGAMMERFAREQTGA